MRVGLDVTPLLRVRTGVAVATELVRDCLRADGHEIVPLLGAWRALRDRPIPLLLRARRNWLPGFLSDVFLDRLRWPSVETVVGRVDAFVATNYAVLPARRARNVALVHDVGRVVHPDLYRPRQVTRFDRLLRRCCALADRVVVPTASVARDLARLDLLPPERIRVVPWAVRATNGAAPRLALPAHAPLIVSAATLDRRKNLDTLLRAFFTAAPRIPHHLVLAGGTGSAAEELGRALEEAPAGRVHLVGHVGRDALAALLRRASFAVCPSFYEGFSLPVLEAMAHGCPVLASDIAAHREVGGDAIRFVPPGDEEAMAGLLVELARDAETRRQLRAAGLRRSRAFAWTNTSRRLAEALIG